jgi:hypothetical protein
MQEEKESWSRLQSETDSKLTEMTEELGTLKKEVSKVKQREDELNQ